MEKREDGWQVIKRRGVPSRALVDCPSAAHDERFSTAPEPEAEQARWQKVGPTLFTNTPSTPTDDSLAAMQRIIDRLPID